MVTSASGSRWWLSHSISAALWAAPMTATRTGDAGSRSPARSEYSALWITFSVGRSTAHPRIVRRVALGGAQVVVGTRDDAQAHTQRFPQTRRKHVIEL